MALQKTAHDACSRKVHCVHRKYLDDPFVSFFAKDSTIINSPLMNRGTWLRTTAIEKCVTNFSKSLDNEPIQIISFGAGVDTLYFRLRKNFPDVRIAQYVELDLPDLVAEKKHIVQRNPPLSSLVGPEYALLPCDLRKPAEVVEVLRTRVQRGAPTIIIAEMVFVYIESAVTTELLQRTLRDVLGAETNVELITYDAMGPNDRFGKVMVESLGTIGVHLKGIDDLPTAESHAQRCRDVGFQSVKAMSMRQLYLTVPRETQMWLNKLEMIDDWDEWNLVHDHYCFVVASTKPNFTPPIFF